MKRQLATLAAILLIGAIGYFIYQQRAPKETKTIPLGLPAVKYPERNPYSKEKEDLGRLLYFDPRLSTDGTVSCSSCHGVTRAFTDNKKVSTGILGRKGTRNSPTVINTAYERFLFWDGRATSLEEQCEGPIGNPKEMTLFEEIHKAHFECQAKIQKIPGYCKLFKQVFHTEECAVPQIADAIATFERSVLSGNSAFDRFRAGDPNAMSEEQIRGFKIYKKVGCINCHTPPTFSDGAFHNIGVGMDKENPDLGRYNITKKESDWGAFKTPTLREVTKTYPYMHDGSQATLEEVIDYYDKGGVPNKNLHPLMKPLHLSDQDKKDLLSFLKALEGEGWEHFKAPDQFP